MMFKAKSSGRDGISRGGCVGSGGVDGLTAAVLVEVDMVDGWVVGELVGRGSFTVFRQLCQLGRFLASFYTPPPLPDSFSLLNSST